VDDSNVLAHEDRPSGSLPTVQTSWPPRNADPSSVPLNTIEDAERAPTLTEVNPDSGSTTGGARIWLKGIDFPALFPLFARFGNAVVPTVSRRFCFSISVSSCLLDLLIIQPSCVSFASHKSTWRHQCTCDAIEGAST